jgi:uncharacterized protein involved in exopolysaccharide biosynthesis
MPQISHISSLPGQAQTPPASTGPIATSVENRSAANWVVNAGQLWEYRRLLARAGVIAFFLSAIIAFTLPKQYESTARLMPPDSAGPSSAMLAALLGRSAGAMGSLGSLAGNLLGTRSSSVLFIDLLHSRSIADHLIDRFDLQHVYRKRYRIDTAKFLVRRTSIVEDKKSGVVTITFADTDPERARAIAQAYIEELNSIVTRANTSSARREREFIEQRLVSVQSELQDAQKALSEFSSINTTLDIKEQTHAMVDAASKLQGEKIVGESELASLEQIYGDDNVRVRAARARIAGLQQELQKLSGSSADLPPSANDNANPYPSIRQLPRLAVPYANLYRRVRIQETVYELLSQQYEMARIEEAKDTPIVSVIDAPQVAEKKSFPPRLLVILILTAAALGIASAFILLREAWRQVDASDSRKLLAKRIAGTVRTEFARKQAAR